MYELPVVKTRREVLAIAHGNIFRRAGAGGSSFSLASKSSISSSGSKDGVSKFAPQSGHLALAGHLVGWGKLLVAATASDLEWHGKSLARASAKSTHHANSCRTHFVKSLTKGSSLLPFDQLVDL